MGAAGVGALSAWVRGVVVGVVAAVLSVPVVALDDAEAESALARGCRLYEDGDRDAALSEFSQVEGLAESRRADLVLQVAAFLAVTHRDFEAAETYAVRAAELDPDFPQSRTPLFHCLLSGRRVPEYEKICRELYQRWPEDPWVVFNLGMACVQGRKHLDADRFYRSALELKPNHTLYLFSAAENAMKLRRYEAAERDLRRCIQLDPDYEGADWLLGQVVALLGRVKEAEVLLRDAAERGGRDAAFALALFLFQQQRVEEALPQFRAIVDARPKDRVVWSYLAQCNQRLRRFEAAKEAARRYRELQSQADRRQEEALLRRIGQASGWKVAQPDEESEGRQTGDEDEADEGAGG